MPNVFSRVAAAYAICGRLIAAVDLLSARNPNHIRFRLTFADGSRLHVSEEWQHETLGAYSYYWLDAHDAFMQGWDWATTLKRVTTRPLTCGKLTAARSNNKVPLLERDS